MVVTLLSLILLAAVIGFGELRVDALGASLARLPPAWLTLAALASVTELGLRVFRFLRILAALDHAVSWRTAAVGQLVGIFAGNVSPMRVGEPVKAVVLHREAGVPLASGIVATVLERVLDLVVLTLLLLLALLTLAEAEFLASREFALLLGVAFIGVYAILLWALARGSLSRWLLARAREGRWFHRVATAFSAVGARGRLTIARNGEWFALSLGILLVDAAIPYSLLLGLGAPLPFLLVVAIVAVGALGGLATQSPGGIGATEALFIFLFVRAGVPVADAASVALLSRVLGFYAFGVVGWALATRLGLRVLARGEKEASPAPAGERRGPK